MSVTDILNSLLIDVNNRIELEGSRGEQPDSELVVLKNNLEIIINGITTTAVSGVVSSTGTTDRGGVTSGTPNTWTQLMPINTSRKVWFMYNLAKNTDNLDIGFYNGGSQIHVVTLKPGESLTESGYTEIVHTDRVDIRCVDSASVSYLAFED